MDWIAVNIVEFYGPTSYLLIFGVLMVCGLGLPIPEDIVLFAAGLFSYYGVSNLWLMIAVSFLGVMVGDGIIFWLGHHYGRKLTKKWIFHKLLPDDRLNAVQRKFHQRGNPLIFMARFMPGLRAPIFFSAGALHLPYRIFIFYDGVAALLSVPAILGAVYYFGDELDEVVETIKRVENGIVLIIVAFILAIIAKWYVTHRRLKRG